MRQPYAVSWSGGKDSALSLWRLWQQRGAPAAQVTTLVDDGSRQSCARVLRELAQRDDGRVRLLRLDDNQGKGGAMIAGFREAAHLGFTHVLQIDADGQHDTRDIPRFLQASQAASADIINGAPVDVR